MARRAAFTAALILICAALQLSVLHYFAIRRVQPDLLLVVTVIIGLWSGPRAAMAVGFSAGVLEGALAGRWIGVYAGAKTIVGYLAGDIAGRVFAESLLVVMGAVTVLTLVNEAIFDIFAHPARLWPMTAYAIERAIYNAGAALLISSALRRLRRLLPPKEVGA